MSKLTILLILVTAFVGANAMSSNNNKTCLFSAISGTITLNGKPVANARIKRVSDERIDESKTDENGYFSMSSVFDTSISNAIRKFVPSQFVSPQKLYVYVDGMEYEILGAVKRREKEFSESLGKPWIVTCELTDRPEVFEIDGNAFYTRCKWDAERDDELEILPPS
jgi:hypothetical protein